MLTFVLNRRSPDDEVNNGLANLHDDRDAYEQVPSSESDTDVAELNQYWKRQRRRIITRSALTSPRFSPFIIILFQSKYDESMTNVKGFDHNSFVYLLRRFDSMFN